MIRFDNPVFWSMPAGHWRGVPLRLSLLCFGALIPVCYHFGLSTGLIYGAAFCGLILLHEAARLSILTPARNSRQRPIIIWPLGNLASEIALVPRGKGFAECFVGVFSLGFCVLIGLATIPSDATPSWRTLLRDLPDLNFSAPFQCLGIVILSSSLKLLIINLLPIRSMDLGRFLEYFLQGSWEEQDRREISLKVGLITAFRIAVLACVEQIWWLVPASFVLIALTIAELSATVEPVAGEGDETFLGYDFSAGYTSLEGSQAEVLSEPLPPAGFMERWMARNAEKKQKQEEELARLIETELDGILQKVHDQGVSSLTPHERTILDQASLQYRKRGKASSM